MPTRSRLIQALDCGWRISSTAKSRLAIHAFNEAIRQISPFASRRASDL